MFKNFLERVLCGTFILSLSSLSAAAGAQTPSYAQPGYSDDEDVINGRVMFIQGQFDLTLHDDLGTIDRIRLHPGTIINPAGSTLVPGMRLTVIGYPDQDVFAANEIDVTYGFSAPTYPVMPMPIVPFGWGCGGHDCGYGSRYDRDRNDRDKPVEKNAHTNDESPTKSPAPKPALRRTL